MNRVDRRIGDLEEAMGASTFVRNVCDDTFIRNPFDSPVMQSSPRFPGVTDGTGSQRTDVLPNNSMNRDHFSLIDFEDPPSERASAPAAEATRPLPVLDSDLGARSQLACVHPHPLRFRDTSRPCSMPSTDTGPSVHHATTRCSQVPSTQTCHCLEDTPSNKTVQFADQAISSDTFIGPLSLQGQRGLLSKPTFRQKPQPYDGKVDWQDYRRQFEIIGNRNGWNDNERADMLAAALRDDALPIQGVFPFGSRIDYSSLCRALEQRFGRNRGTYLTTFRLRLQRSKESITEFAFELKRLALAAFSECPDDAVEQLVVNQFIEGLRESNTQLMVQLSRPKNLSNALQTAMEVDARLGSRTGSRNLFLVDNADQTPVRRRWNNRHRGQTLSTSPATNRNGSSGNPNPSA